MGQSPEILSTSNERPSDGALPSPARLDYVDDILADIVAGYDLLQATEKPGMVSFVEAKPTYAERWTQFLRSSESVNRWSNRGPVWYALSRAYERYFSNLSGKKVVPCANGGIALEALAKLHELRENRPLRWCVSAFSFANAGRGYFANSLKLDCDEQGVLSRSELERADPDTFDGIIVTNPFGILKDFDPLVSWQKENGKHLLIDNAAGISHNIPNLSYQAFSCITLNPSVLAKVG